jgi:hypothetical protein
LSMSTNSTVITLLVKLVPLKLIWAKRSSITSSNRKRCAMRKRTKTRSTRETICKTSEKLRKKKRTLKTTSKISNCHLRPLKNNSLKTMSRNWSI